MNKEKTTSNTVNPTTDTTAAASNTTTSTLNPQPAIKISASASLIFSILALILGGGGLAISVINLLKAPITPISTSFNSDGNSANFTEGSIAEVASRVTPGVVSILTETRTSSWLYGSNVSTSAGTGMIVTGDGYVITNKHVVDGARNIQVILDDGTTYNNVKIVGTDPINDVAYLKIANVSELPVVTLGDSKTITVGQQVIAIGNALGQYQNTITSGIISGAGRSLTACADEYCTEYEDLSDMIQTDASINAGNSGGPLVNAAGEVIGINTAVSSEGNNIGFAIPISSVKGMLKNIIENGKAERAYAGIYSIDITPEVAKEYDLPTNSGTYVFSDNETTNAVVKGGPADLAGIKSGDIITHINGVAVGKMGSVRSLIGEYAPGDTVQFTILRDGAEQITNLTLTSYKNR